MTATSQSKPETTFLLASHFKVDYFPHAQRRVQAAIKAFMFLQTFLDAFKQQKISNEPKIRPTSFSNSVI